MLEQLRHSDSGQVMKAVARVIARRGLKIMPLRDDDLKERGLTSLDMVNLMLAVECECGVTIPQSAMTPDHFHSIATIEALVASLHAADQDSSPSVDDRERAAAWRPSHA
jgi:acyl carrier protein